MKPDCFGTARRHHVFACEGGHTDFAPQDDLQIELLRFLQARFGHVSYERILSGPGLVNVYEFLRDSRMRKGICRTGGSRFKKTILPRQSRELLWRIHPLAEKASRLVDLRLRSGSIQSGAESHGHRRLVSDRRHLAQNSSKLTGPAVHAGVPRKGPLASAGGSDPGSGRDQRKGGAAGRGALRVGRAQ